MGGDELVDNETCLFSSTVIHFTITNKTNVHISAPALVKADKIFNM